MNVTHIVFDVNTYWNKARSLKVLRDTIAKNAHRRIAVVEVPTNNLYCGYLILDWEWQRATWTGDGFRLDDAGEGGVGRKTAEVIFNLFGIRPLPWEMVNIEEIYTLPEDVVEKRLLELAQTIASELSGDEFSVPINSKPGGN
jgi:hypothetical protein